MSFDEAPSSSFRASLKTFSDALFDLEEVHVAAHTAEGAADICNVYAGEAKEWANWLKRGQAEWGGK